MIRERDDVTKQGKQECGDLGNNYAKLFDSFCKNISEYDAHIRNLITQEQSFSRKKEDYYISLSKGLVNSEKHIKDVALAMIERMIWTAQDLFAPIGASLKIDKNKVMQACGYSGYDRDSKEPDWSIFNAEKVWNYLSAHYGGSKGEEEGHRQTAKNIVDSFHLKPGGVIKTVGGRTILEISVYIDPFDKKWSKKNKISHGCSEKIIQTILALKGFAAWCNKEDLASDLSISLHHLGDYRSEITSRAIYGGHGIRIVTYLNRFEFQLEADVAEQLQLFLALYAFPELQEAA